LFDESDLRRILFLALRRFFALKMFFFNHSGMRVFFSVCQFIGVEND